MRRRSLTAPFALLLVAGIGAGLDRPEVREHVARGGIRAVSEGIAGSLTVGPIAHVGLDGSIAARDVRFLDERGAEVIFAEKARVHVDLAALAHGEIRFDHASARGGRVRIAERADGSWGIDTAFRGSGDGGPSPTVTFDALDVSHVRVTVAAHHAPALEIDDVRARVSLSAGGRPTVVRFEGARGQVHVAEPMPLEARIRSASGRFEEGARRRFVADVAATFLGDDTDLTLALVEEGDRLRLRSDTHATGLFGAALGVALELL